MSVDSELQARSASKCELCSATENLVVYEVPPSSNGSVDKCVLICATCQAQIEDSDKIEVNHWRCLNDSMWSQVPAVQVVVWRLLTRLRTEGWPQDLLDMLYLEEATLAWAQADGDGEIDAGDGVKHIDSNGTLLAAGDTVTLVKDLNVKGGGFTAKRGAVVRGISLVADNPDHVEGRVNGQLIVILTKFVKKSN